MRIHLARHTETNYNEINVINSDPGVDVHLTERGIKQAEKLARSLADTYLEVCFVSDLPRTRQTASIVLNQRSVPIVADTLINEYITGFEGRNIQEWREALEKQENPWPKAFNNGESMESAFNRAEEFIEFLRRSPYDSVLVITHGFFVEALYGISQGFSGESAMGHLVPQGEYIEISI